MQFQCPCGTMLSSSNPPGSRVRCPSCDRVLLMPSAASPSEGELIRFSCSCGKPLRTRRLPGTQAKCPNCGQTVIVPAPEQAAPATDGQPPQPSAPPVAEWGSPAPADDMQEEVDPAQYAATTDLPGLGSEGKSTAPPPPAPPSPPLPEKEPWVPDTRAMSSARVRLHCQCGTTLEMDQPPGTSVHCPNCSRLMVVPQPEAKAEVRQGEEDGVEFQCVCGCTLASSEPTGSEVECPSCGRMVVVPPGMGETQQVLAEIVAAASSAPSPPPAPPSPPVGQTVEFSCSCGTVLASAEPPGTEVTCPTCHRIIIVPSTMAPAAPGPSVPQPEAVGGRNLGIYLLVGIGLLAAAIIAVAFILKPQPQPQPQPPAPAVTAEAPQQPAPTTAPAQPAETTPAAPEKPPTAEAKPAVPEQKVTEVNEKVEVSESPEAVVELLGSAKDEVRDAAEDKLGDMGNEAVDVLREALTKGKDADMKMRAGRALRRIGNEGAASALQIGLKDKDAKVRKTCARSLGSVGSEASSSLPALIDLLTDQDFDVRVAALDALATVGGHTVERSGDLVDTDPKKLQEEWRKWFEAGAKPDPLASGKGKKEGKEAAAMHTHMHVHVNGTRHTHEHYAAEHDPNFDVLSGLSHHGAQQGDEKPTLRDDEEETEQGKKPEGKKTEDKKNDEE